MLVKVARATLHPIGRDARMTRLPLTSHANKTTRPSVTTTTRLPPGFSHCHDIVGER
jgi:hypothetical protein